MVSRIRETLHRPRDIAVRLTDTRPAEALTRLLIKVLVLLLALIALHRLTIRVCPRPAAAAGGRGRPRAAERKGLQLCLLGVWSA